MSQFLKFYFTSVPNMFRTLIHPSSGACDFFVVSPHWSCVLVSMCVGVSVWLGWGWATYIRGTPESKDAERRDRKDTVYANMKHTLHRLAFRPPTVQRLTVLVLQRSCMTDCQT